LVGGFDGAYPVDSYSTYPAEGKNGKGNRVGKGGVFWNAWGSKSPNWLTPFSVFGQSQWHGTRYLIGLLFSSDNLGQTPDKNESFSPDIHHFALSLPEATSQKKPPRGEE